MKIVKRGKAPDERIWKGSCNNSNSVIEAEQKELKITYTQKDGDFGTGNCPVCEHQIFFHYDRDND